MSTNKTRTKLAYVPEFKGEIEGYVVNSIARQAWRVAPLHDHEDLKQEAFIVFMRCAARYPILDEAKHFMALFKVAWANHLNDLSRKASRVRETQVLEADRAIDPAERALDEIGDLDNDGKLRTMIRQAPREILLVLNLFLNAPTELLDLATRAWEQSNRKAPGADNVMVSRLLGLDPTENVLQRTHDYFAP